LNTKTFKGHGTLAMFLNIILALLPTFLLWFTNSRPAEEIRIFRGLLMFEITWFIAFPTYLFFELKHLMLKDGIAEDSSLSSFLVFGGQSLLGLIMQIFVLVSTLKLELFGVPSMWLLILLSFLASFGACLGLTDLPLLFIVFPHKIIEHSLIVFKSWRLSLVCLLTTALLSFLTSLFI
jgi:hypothetical protein